MFFTGFTVLGLSLVTAIVADYHLPRVWAIPLFLVSALLSLIGLYDLAQPLHSVRRNYPSSAAFAGCSRRSGRKSGNI